MHNALHLSVNFFILCKSEFMIQFFGRLNLLCAHHYGFHVQSVRPCWQMFADIFTVKWTVVDVPCNVFPQKLLRNRFITKSLFLYCFPSSIFLRFSFIKFSFNVWPLIRTEQKCIFPLCSHNKAFFRQDLPLSWTKGTTEILSYN